MSVFQRVICYYGVCILGCTATGSPSDVGSPLIVLKVFFTNICNSDGSRGGGGASDRGKEMIDMTGEEFQLLRLILMENHLTLPPSLRVAMKKKVCTYKRVCTCRWVHIGVYVWEGAYRRVHI